MTDAALTARHFTPFDCDRSAPRPPARIVAGAALLAVGALAGAWGLDIRRGAGPDAVVLVERPAPALPAPVPAMASALSGAVPAAEMPFEAALLDPGFSLGPAPAPFAERTPLEARLAAVLPPAAEAPPAGAPAPAAPLPPEAVMVADAASPPAASPPVAALPAAAVLPAAAPPSVAAPPPDAIALPSVAPLPLPRPSGLGWAVSREPARATPRRAPSAVATAAPAAPPPPDDRGFFEKFFGVARPTGPSLAYASPEDGLAGRGPFRTSPAVPSQDRFTAVYDIAAHTVYLPGGGRLEAHSGLGAFIDDPHHVDERNRGATPPHLYELTLREQLFHGVQALRLNPVGGGGVYGRTGLLAHTFMLGPKGDSNGCVSFRDYRSFLQAYLSGEVKRLVVVASLN